MWLQNIWNMLLFCIFIIQYRINIVFRLKKQQQKQTLFFLLFALIDINKFF